MVFVFIMIFHLLGDYICQPILLSNKVSNGMLSIITRSIVYTLVMYIGLPVFIITLQIYSGLTINDFLMEYGLSNINNWDFGISLYILIGYLSIDIWSHKLIEIFDKKYTNTNKWWWLYLSNIITGIDFFLHTMHLYLVYFVIFT